MHTCYHSPNFHLYSFIKGVSNESVCVLSSNTRYSKLNKNQPGQRIKLIMHLQLKFRKCENCNFKRLIFTEDKQKSKV